MNAEQIIQILYDIKYDRITPINALNKIMALKKDKVEKL